MMVKTLKTAHCMYKNRDFLSVSAGLARTEYCIVFVSETLFAHHINARSYIQTQCWINTKQRELNPYSSRGEEGLYQTVMPVIELNNNSLHALRLDFFVDRKTKPDTGEEILNSAVSHTKRNSEHEGREAAKAGAQ